ncbi:hypothetical protein EX30DRAFT_371536 [Ascodesmis nigricans]|uniref:Phosphatases II n=1 Tax=Ascodesmis nigricans TaxID=341454 RepID=A0A4S2MWY9_9PEZI|nr:hypothetical protein EX30DRAFT_371536 [Ascodesmis nigricans]
MTNTHWRPPLPLRAHTSPHTGHHNLAHHVPPVSTRRPRPKPRKSLRSDDKNLPLFLCQDQTDIKRKFYELENLQGERLTESLDPPPPPQKSRWRLDDSDTARSRNRYGNIAPWEANRIRLKVPPHHNDYINASPIKLRRSDGSVKRYIATQGPKRGQLHHLWRMVWHETGPVAVIVMLTKTSELGMDKCYQYFPGQVGEEPLKIVDQEFGDGFAATIQLLDLQKDRKSASEVRKLEMKVGGKSKTVWHLYFKGWPDYNVPDGTDKLALLELVRLANEKNTGAENPLIVHCSAGVGRSGTFITLDHFLFESSCSGFKNLKEHDDPIFEVVNKLREQRMHMVQSQVQFHFLYQVLREVMQERAKSVSPRSSGELAKEGHD